MLLTSLLLLLLACSYTAQNELDCSKFEEPKRNLSRNVLPQARGDRFVDFDWELVKELNAASEGNLVISPISLKIVLAMLSEGATGQTAHEIREALNLDNITSALPKKTRDRFSLILKSLEAPDGQNKIKIGTHVYIDKNTEPKDRFQCILKLYYNSAMEKVDFSNTTAAVNVINSWASNVTEGHIEHLLSEAEAQSSTIMLLLNAVYFKGLWKAPFLEELTAPGTFYVNEKLSTNNVPFMKTTDRFYYNSIEELDAQMIKLPYLGDKFSMYVLLPNKKHGLNALAEKLGPNRPLTEYLRNMVETPVHLVLPKFEYRFTTSLRPILEKMNITKMFSPASELSGIADTIGGGLVVSNVLQKAGISVNEIGSEAYAATVVDLMDKFGGGEEVVEFRADHPFLFFIEDDSVKTTLFVGKVTNPEEAQVTGDKIGNNKGPITEPEKPVTEPTPGIAATTPATTSSHPEELFDYDQEAIQAKFNYFDADLLKELSDKQEDNFVVSPTSVKTLLALILEASEGTTQAEILKVLRLPQNLTYARQTLASLQTSLKKSPSSKVTVDSVAQVFVQNTLKTNASYVKILKDYYKADASPQDFTSPEVAANNINSWIRTRTGALISELVDQELINANTFALLTSAVYFDGKWKNEFETTKNECFYSGPNHQCQMVPTMYKNEELPYKFDQSLDSHVLEIPYLDERFSMVIVLPRKIDGMKQLAVDASRLSFPRLLNNMNRFEVNLKMPKFSVDYGSELTHTLEKLSLIEVFTDNAQLPYMINGRQSRVSAIVHKAKIEVTEKGTKAAAASGAAVVPLMFGLGVIDLQVNHPFYFFVYDGQTQTVLFTGRLSSVVSSPHVPSGPPAVVPLGAPGSQPTYYADPSVGLRQHQSNVPVTSTVRPQVPAIPNGQSSYSAPTNIYNSQPSYAATAGGANSPTNQATNAVETHSVRPKPNNHGAQNHRYNPQAPTRGYTYKEFEYPGPTADRRN